MRKSSFGGRPSISGAPLRVRNENTSHHGHRNRASSGDRASTGRLSHGGSKLPVGNSRKSVAASNQFSFVPRSGRPSSGIGVRGRTDIPKDPRPITDKKYQNRCIKQLLEFLTCNKYPHPISQKLLVSPSSKDFFKIFEFVYGKICEGYKQVPKMEDEVPRVLKILGYPFGLSKTYLFSVGSPHTWPHLLAALVWMIDLIQMAESVSDHGGIDAFIFEPTDDDFDGISEEKILFDYFEKTYAAFMAGADTFEEHDETLEQFLLHKSQGGNIQDIIEENVRLEAEVSLIEQSEEKLRKLRERANTLKLDEKTVQTYIENLLQYKKAAIGELEKKEEECKMLKSDFESEKEKLEHMHEVYERQDLKPADVDRLKAEQEGLRQQVDHLEKQIAVIDTDNWNVSMEQAKINEKIEMAVATYNRLAIALKLVPETAELANGKDFRLRTGISHSIVSSFELNVKPMLTLMKKRYADELRRKNKEKFQMTYQIEQLQESVTEKKEQLKLKEKELAATESEIDSLKQLTHTGKQSGEIENLKQTLAQLGVSHKQAKAEKAKAFEEYETTCQLLQRKREEVKTQMAELEESKKKVKESIANHVQSWKKQLTAYVKGLKSASQEMDSKMAHLQEDSGKRQEWLTSLLKKK